MVLARARRTASLAVVALGAMFVANGSAGAGATAAEASSGAYGFSAKVSILGGAPSIAGPAPTVTLPPEGASAPITVTDPSGKAQFGPALLFQSKALTVSTEVTKGPGLTATSSAEVTGDSDGPSTVAFQQITSTCSASDSNTTASSSISGGVLATSTDDEGEPLAKEPIPESPPANYTRTGTVDHVGDNFKVVFNEQIRDGASITVNAVHEYLLGPAAVGDIIIGQSRCAIPSAEAVSTAASGSSKDSDPNVVPFVFGAFALIVCAAIVTFVIRR